MKIKDIIKKPIVESEGDDLEVKKAVMKATGKSVSTADVTTYSGGKAIARDRDGSHHFVKKVDGEWKHQSKHSRIEDALAHLK